MTKDCKLYKDAWPWKKRPLGCLLAASDIASHTTVSAPWASVRSLFFIFAWKSGMDDCTAVDRTQTRNNILATEVAQYLTVYNWCKHAAHLGCLPSRGAWMRSGFPCAELPIALSWSPVASEKGHSLHQSIFLLTENIKTIY